MIEMLHGLAGLLTAVLLWLGLPAVMNFLDTEGDE